MGELFIRGGGAKKLIDISDATITLDSTTLTYNEEIQTQEITSVVLNGTSLTPNVDYIVTGNQQKNAGSYTLTIYGIGKYTGNKSASWSIAKASATISSPSSNGTIYFGVSNATKYAYLHVRGKGGPVSIVSQTLSATQPGGASLLSSEPDTIRIQLTINKPNKSNTIHIKRIEDENYKESSEITLSVRESEY